MALARIKTWNAAETLTASDLNAEFNNICNHFGSLDNDDIDSTATYVMGELIVGTGITSADGGQLHVHTGSAGTIQASGDADEAVFENSGASGVTILSGTTSTGNIAFGDSGDADNGLLKYTHGATPTLGITVDATAVQSIAAAATTLAHDLAIYQDANNADSQIALGTSATEALFVEALNGASNKTLEELRFTTKTASGTAHHGKMSFYVDEVNIGNINDAGITLESGMVFTGNVTGNLTGNVTGNVTGNTSGTAATVTSGTQAAITTCANLTTVGTVTTGTWSGVIDGSATMTLGSDATGDVYYRDASGFLERLGASTDGYVLTTGGAGTVPAWEALPSSGISFNGSTANGIATYASSSVADVEANLTFDGTLLAAADGSQLVVGNTAAITTDRTAGLQVLGSGNDDASLLIGRFDNGTVGGKLAFVKSRNATIGGNTIVQSGDQVGGMAFNVSDGGDMVSNVAQILVKVDGTPGANDTPGRIEFWTTPDGSYTATERMRIDSAGYVGINETNPTARLYVKESVAGTGAQTNYKNNESASNTHYWAACDRSATSAYNFYAASSDVNGSSDSEFILAGDGNAYADGSWNASGADYQEWFESADSTEYEVGKAVVLDGDKVRVYDAATDSADNIFGITRPQADNKNSAVIGNTAWNHWTDKYLTDDWGVYIREDYTVWSWDVVLYVDGDALPENKKVGDVKIEAGTMASYKIPEGWTPPANATTVTQSKRKLNPEYSVEVDDETSYTPRADRTEWNLIGMLGQVQVKASEPTNPRWIKMKDISDAVELWMIR